MKHGWYRVARSGPLSICRLHLARAATRCRSSTAESEPASSARCEYATAPTSRCSGSVHGARRVVPVRAARGSPRSSCRAPTQSEHQIAERHAARPCRLARAAVAERRGEPEQITVEKRRGDPLESSETTERASVVERPMERDRQQSMQGSRAAASSVRAPRPASRRAARRLHSLCERADVRGRRRLAPTPSEVVERLRAAVESTGATGFGGVRRALSARRRPAARGLDRLGRHEARPRARARRLRACGADLAAHCINDVITRGAEPLFLLDYVAANRIDLEQVAELVEGAAEVCREAGCRAASAARRPSCRASTARASSTSPARASASSSATT